MSNSFTAIILDDSSDKSLLNLIKKDLKINSVKKYVSTIDALEAIQEYKNINLVFIHYETTLDKTFSFVQTAKESGNCDETKFILLGFESSQEFLANAAKSGISAFVLKPYKDKKLIDKATRLLPVIRKKEKNRLNLLESVEAELRFKNQEVIGNIGHISDKACTIHLKKFGRLGLEVFNAITIRVNFEDVKLGINAQVVKIEKDSSKDYKAFLITLQFKKPDGENALNFAKFWAYILKERENI